MRILLVFIGVMALVGTAHGVMCTQNVAGATSWDAQTDPDNTVLDVDMAAKAGVQTGTRVVLTALGWDVTISTVGASWLSEATVRLSNRTQTGGIIHLRPGISDTNSGTQAYSSGMLDFSDLSLANIVLEDGYLRIEFFEEWDDVADAVDATWTAGDLFFEAVPATSFCSLSVTGIEMSVTITNLTPGVTNRIFRTFDLMGGVWTNLNTFVPVGNSVEFKDTIPAPHSTVIYKTVTDVE